MRESVIELFLTGVVAADPYQALKRYLEFKGGQLEISTTDKSNRNGIRTKPWVGIHMMAIGKAACPMIKAALEIIPSDRIGRAVAVTNYENRQSISGADVIAAGHPIPDEAGIKAAEVCINIANNAKAGELVLLLISGGGSALLPYPVETVTLQDKILTTQLLLGSGATINEINCVRKHLSRIKGGGIARAIEQADYHAMLLSDVIGDDVSSIASGPTVPDSTTFAEAIDILEHKKIWVQIPKNVRRYLNLGQRGEVDDTPKPGDKVFDSGGYSLIGSNRISVDAVIKRATYSDCHTVPYSYPLCGEAREEAKKLVNFAKIECMGTNRKSLAIIAGGETTVTLTGSGKGGRNQEFALAFVIEADRQQLPGHWVLLSGGTDGRDGPTEAAGGVVDSTTFRRLINAGIDPGAKLTDNDSHSALKIANDLLITGATGTNVADIQILLIQP
jgi:glycerate-2-kinase